MVRIDGTAVWFFLPAVTDIFIGGKPFESVESLSEVVRPQESVEGLLQGLMGLVIVCFDRGFLEGSIHALPLAIGPGMIGFGQPMGHGVFITDACNDGCEGILILLPLGKLDAMLGEPGVKFGRHTSHEMAQERCRPSLDGLRGELGRRELRRAVDGAKEVERACFGLPLGDIDVAGADRIGFERCLPRCVALDGWQAADAVPLHTAGECGARPVGDGRLPGL